MLVIGKKSRIVECVCVLNFKISLYTFDVKFSGKKNPDLFDKKI